MPHIDNKAFFIHIPKTGGTSIEEAFEGKYGETSKFKEPCSTQHLHYSELEDLEQYKFVFAIIRDPVERLISEYKWSRTYWPDAWEKYTFSGFVRHMFSEFKKNPYVQDNHIRPQVEFIGPAVTNIYRFPEAFAQIPEDLRAIGIKCDELPISNSMGECSEFNIRVGSVLLKEIQKFYADDFALYRKLTDGYLGSNLE